MTAPVKDGTTYDITPGQIQRWSRAMPGMDIERELRLAVSWLEDNEAKRKTRRGMPRYFGSWLRTAYAKVHVPAQGEKLDLQQVDEGAIVATAKVWQKKHGFTLEKAMELARNYYTNPDRQGMAMVGGE